MSNTQNTIVNLLTEQTQTLKNQFVQFTTDYATNEFNTITMMTSDDIRNKFGRSTKEAKKVYAMRNEMTAYGIESYINKAVANAINHYNDSIVKLAIRIESKGLNIDTITMNTTHIGVNIETIITDGVKKVKAQTILAYGEVQKPHYRYLVK